VGRCRGRKGEKTRGGARIYNSLYPIYPKILKSVAYVVI